MTKYIVKKAWEGMKEGDELELHLGNHLRYASLATKWDIAPHEIALLLHTGFIEEVNGKWKPKHGDRYFYLDTIGEFSVCRWQGDEVDLYRLSIGNVHRTEEEAIKYRDRLIALHSTIGDSLNRPITN